MSALSDLRIVELAESVAGEYCGKLLADFGADVIKIEKPGSGSPTRSLGPFASEGPAGETSGLFAYLNTNKRSVTLDLSTDAGVATLGKLIAAADAVIDDHAPGWLKSVGLDPDRIEEDRPALVLCSITPYGQDAPEDRRHAEDLNVLHASGWGYHTPSHAKPDQPPLKGAGRFMVSYEAGQESALCVVASLFEREELKRGRFIDISKQQVMASRTDYVLSQMVAGDMDVTNSRHAFDLWGPATILPCRDGFIYIWLSDEGQWQAMRQLMGEPEWTNEDFPPHWLQNAVTPDRVARCRQGIAEWLKDHDKHQVSAAAQKVNIMMVPVNNAPDLMASPQYKHRGFFTEVEHEVLGKALYPTVPYRLSVTPARIRTAAPLLGKHNDEVLDAAEETQSGRARTEA